MADTAAHNLRHLAEELLTTAANAGSGRAARGVYRGKYLKQALLALTAGSELSEHEAPPEATLQVIRGRVTLSTTDHSWDLVTGDLMAIPPARHSVSSIEDSAFLLTIRMDVTGA